jgi:hypothetical protein
METIQNNQLITTIVTRMVLQIAPHEIQLFQGQKEEYLRNPQEIINNRGYSNTANSKEKILFLAPIIHSILYEVISMLEQDRNNGNLKGPSILQNPQLSPEKAKSTYEFAYEKACQHQLSPLKSHVVANAVLENLGQFSMCQ